MKFKELKIKKAEELVFGSAPEPVKTMRGLEIGGGKVYPELNFTVPEGTVINRQTLPELAGKYSNAVREAIQRALELHCEGLVIEFETLLEMTLDPFIGTEITKRMNDVCEEYFSKYGLKSEIRLTPNDTRDFDRPPKMRSGKYLEGMFKLFEDGAKAGGNLLSIETTGGKEICDDALIMCDIKGVIFSMAVLGVRDMKFIWKNIVKAAQKTGRIAGGDTACGFGNTAMVLAEKQYIPRTFAAAVRAATIVRSLIALEEGATGPDKDCGYEGVFLKAIKGIPISMEGKTAACAHLSPIGNVAAACADLWSNESIQNIKLLGGMAPTVYMEQLIYDTRLMNEAAKESVSRLKFRDLLANSDAIHDPQALILVPDNVIEISREIVKGKNHLDATLRGVNKAMLIIEDAINREALKISEREIEWIDRIKAEVASIPCEEDKFIDEMLPQLDSEKFIPEEYAIK